MKKATKLFFEIVEHDLFPGGIREFVNIACISGLILLITTGLALVEWLVLSVFLPIELKILIMIFLMPLTMFWIISIFARLMDVLEKEKRKK